MTLEAEHRGAMPSGSIVASMPAQGWFKQNRSAIVRHGVLGAGMAFLSKPFTPDALALKVREVLETAPRSVEPPAADAPPFSRGVEPTVGAATGPIVQRAEDVGGVRRSRI